MEEFKQQTVNKYNYYLANELIELLSSNGTIKIMTTNKAEIYAEEDSIETILAMKRLFLFHKVGNLIVQYYNGKFITDDNRIATSLDKEKLDNKFLYYTLLNKIDLIASFCIGAVIKHPDIYTILELEIPILALSVQNHVVDILDKFSTLINDLNEDLPAELEQRQKQYEYCKDMLLSFPH